MEAVRPARREDRQACTRLLSQALVGAAAMRGGAALVGDATPVTLLERWTAPEERSHLVVGEYDGVVVGLMAVTIPQPGGDGRGPDRVLLRRVGCPRRRRGIGPHGGRRGLVHGHGLHRCGRPGVTGGPSNQATTRGGRPHRPVADAQPPAGLKRRSALARGGGGGGIRRPSSLARAGTAPAA